jgi:hypothetical protein
MFPVPMNHGALGRLWAVAVLAVATACSGAEVLRFNRDIRPILSEACFSCHGADSAARKSELRLDVREAALKGGKSDLPALAPGDLKASEMVRRITTADEEDVMPPRKAARQLTPSEIETLKRWVAAGGEYEAHWAFIKPVKAPVPNGAAHPIDAFIAERLTLAGLKPSAEADRRTLVRRVCLDLTGLPPTPEEVAQFVADPRPDAYETLVDRLLASPRYGEHLAVWWLDLARYADTSGFQGDPLRTMWRWRDYVIDSFNANKPFDQFTVEQIAGDLLPDATMEQRLATGFNRNHRFNTEFGSLEDEWRVENVIDRVEATSATWLGLTMGCARCHDHKFDPVSQRDFYKFFAFFNHIPERGVFWDVFGDQQLAFEPNMRAPLPADQPRLAALSETVTNAAEALLALDAALGPEQAEWERAHPGRKVADFAKEPGNLVVRLPLAGSFAATFGLRSEISKRLATVTNRLAGGDLSVVTSEVAQTNLTEFGQVLAVVPGAGARFVDGGRGPALEIGSRAPSLAISNIFDRPRATLAMWVRPDSTNGVLLSQSGRQPLFPLGISLSLTNGHVRFELDHRYFDFDATMVPVVLTSAEPVTPGRWLHLAVVLDGNRMNRGPTLFLNGEAMEAEARFQSMRALPEFRNEAPLLVGGDVDGAGLKGVVSDLRIYDRALNDDEVGRLAHWPGAGSLALDPDLRTAGEAAEATAFYRDFVSPTHAAAAAELGAAERGQADFERTLPLVMVMKEKPGPPTARMLGRGQYDQPGDTVVADVPAVFGRLTAGAPTNRLGLARWIVSPENPLTARVLVNRLWERFFGTGLVRTSENLGVQAEAPSHPELLDWLAVEMVEGHWDLKAIQKTIVLSSTYRQSSVFIEAARRLDPENRLLSHGARFRLGAEAIRDEALAVSGLLVERVGGPSVTPYLPGEKPGFGEDLYRRSVYSFWQRTRFNPSLASFDATAREYCTVKRPRTNTPLQALALMNEVTYLEAARRLAERMMVVGRPPAERIARGFELVLGRSPTLRETKTLETLLAGQLERFRNDAGAAAALLRQGASPVDASLPASELAAYSLVASALLNTDEFVTRE